ncbi:hypothetical protein AMTRI_Chr06g174210 [Amborella trichopoda]
MFDNFITSNELFDFNNVGTTFTWSNNSALHPKLSKLDRFLVSSGWDTVFPKFLVKAVPQLASDYVPILLDTNGDVIGLPPVILNLCG